jgi:hypothetical protein
MPAITKTRDQLPGPVSGLGGYIKLKLSPPLFLFTTTSYSAFSKQKEHGMYVAFGNRRD